jgi:spermidine synthase
MLPRIRRPEPETANASQAGLDLFLTGFLVLFFELACIRWFSAVVPFLQFFTNVVLIASFLGMSCGCLAAGRRLSWLGSFPLFALIAVVSARATLVAYNHWATLVVDIGRQAAPQEVFFGAEARSPDVARFVVPIEAIATLFFILIALMFVGLGQTLGRAFGSYPNRVRGYALNIGGSLAGIVTFSALSFAQTSPAVWFLFVYAGVGYLLWRERRLSSLIWLAAAASMILVFLPLDGSPTHETRWSPYYAVDHDKSSGVISVDNIGHQRIQAFEKGGAIYSLIHLLARESGYPPFRDVLVIGAGSGNDVAHALRFGASHVDAVEIDPVIEDIGLHYHPDRPYESDIVTLHIDDGRHFLRTADQKYDLVVYALVDSLILHSGYANIRLESYLFTEEAFADVRRVLKPNGVFVMYNNYRRGWIVQRVAAMAKKIFGCDPLVLPVPYAETIKSTDKIGFTVIASSCNMRIADEFKQHGAFKISRAPLDNLAAHGFSPIGMPDNWEPLSPATLIVDDPAAELPVTDDWPFLYLSAGIVPALTVRSIIIFSVVGLAMVYAFLRRDRLRPSSRMFFLGAAFMLLETKAVVQMALLFGSTWLVNSAVFFTVLVFVLLANLYILAVPTIQVRRHYLALIFLLSASILTPLNAFLNGGPLWRYAVPCALALGPMFFAGVIFARSFRDELHPDQALGFNIAGSVIGGVSEPFSTILGFRHLLVLAICFYILSAWSPSARIRA